MRFVCALRPQGWPRHRHQLGRERQPFPSATNLLAMKVRRDLRQQHLSPGSIETFEGVSRTIDTPPCSTASLTRNGVLRVCDYRQLERACAGRTGAGDRIGSTVFVVFSAELAFEIRPELF
jgi:hypothetical protein